MRGGLWWVLQRRGYAPFAGNRRLSHEYLLLLPLADMSSSALAGFFWRCARTAQLNLGPPRPVRKSSGCGLPVFSSWITTFHTSLIERFAGAIRLGGGFWLFRPFIAGIWGLAPPVITHWRYWQGKPQGIYSSAFSLFALDMCAYLVFVRKPAS
jgi:hypothetical protein